MNEWNKNKEEEEDHQNIIIITFGRNIFFPATKNEIYQKSRGKNNYQDR